MTACLRVACAAVAVAVASAPAFAEVPYDGWRGQRAAPTYAGAWSDRRPLDNSVRSGEPYAMPRERRPASRPSLWHGFYVGGHIGGAWASATPQWLTSQDVSLEGFVGGAHAGYNFEIGQLVLGMEADATLASIDGTRHDSSIGTATSVGLDWMATLRARAGMTWDNFLFYGTAGVAFTHMDLDVTAGGQSSARDVLTGFVWGGGVEMKINPQLSARIEALRYNFGEETFGSVAGPVSIGADVTTIRAGLSWHFN